MEIIDAQVHLNAIGVDAAIPVMDALGIAGVVVDPWPLTGERLANGAFRCNYDFAIEANRRHPDRFAFLVRPDQGDPELSALMPALKRMPGCLAIRVDQPSAVDLRAGCYDNLFAIAESIDIPACVILPGRILDIEPVVRRHPSLQFVVDHAGMPLHWNASDPDRFKSLDDLLSLARYSNVAIKWGHVAKLTTSHFPYPDVLEQLCRAMDAFGARRIMWESDVTLAAGYQTWGEDLFCIRAAARLSEDDKAWILGRTARAILRWNRPDDMVRRLLVAEEDWEDFQSQLAKTGRFTHGQIRIERLDRSARTEREARDQAVSTRPLAGARQVSVAGAVRAALTGRGFIAAGH